MLSRTHYVTRWLSVSLVGCLCLPHSFSLSVSAEIFEHVPLKFYAALSHLRRWLPSERPCMKGLCQIVMLLLLLTPVKD